MGVSPQWAKLIEKVLTKVDLTCGTLMYVRGKFRSRVLDCVDDMWVVNMLTRHAHDHHVATRWQRGGGDVASSCADMLGVG